MINIGHITARKTWGSHQLRLAVHDWSLEDLKRFRTERPALFAGM